MEWCEELVENIGDLFIAIMMSGLIHYSWVVRIGRIIDKDIKPFKDNEEKE